MSRVLFFLITPSLTSSPHKTFLISLSKSFLVFTVTELIETIKETINRSETDIKKRVGEKFNEVIGHEGRECMICMDSCS